MLSSSLRRVAWTPLAPISGISRSSTQTLSTSSNGLLGATQHVRQRRYSSSSSKPSDGSRRVEASSQAPTKGVNSGEKREGKASKRRGKDNGRNGPKSNQPSAFSNLPSVPSTQHLQPHGEFRTIPPSSDTQGSPKLTIFFLSQMSMWRRSSPSIAPSPSRPPSPRPPPPKPSTLSSQRRSPPSRKRTT